METGKTVKLIAQL